MGEGDALLGWQVSDAVRCDPAYRNRRTGGGRLGESGRFVSPTPDGRPVERQRITTTLRPEALAILREAAERDGISRNEVIERLLLGGGSLEKEPASHVVSTKASTELRDRIHAAAAKAGQTPSTYLRDLLGRVVP